MQVCTSLQADNHASTPPLSFLQAGCPSCRPTNSVKALKGTRQRHTWYNNCRPTLLSATTKGVLRLRRSSIDSRVCGSRPCMMSTTRIARSHSDDPRLRRLLQRSRQRYFYFASAAVAECWGTGVVICLERDAAGPADATATHCLLLQ